MSALTSVSYPHDPRTKIPAALKAMRIWEQAWSLRRQIGFGPEDGLIVDVQTVVEKTETLSINGVLLSTCWDFTQGVSNVDGHPSLGICLYLPDVDPETAMISVNGPLIGDRPYLMRSTGLHELGHVIYDVPPGIAAYKQGVGQSLSAHRSEPPGDDHLATVRRPQSPEEWSEWRANEFMGGFLVPEFLLRREVLRLHREHGLPMARIKGCGELFGSLGRRLVLNLDVMSVRDQFGLNEALANLFGVSPQFIRVRLDKYRLFQGRFAAH